MTKADKLAAWALSKVGCGYIWGATGYVLSRAKYDAMAPGNDAIRRYGTRWIGKQCYDCAQLVRWGCRAAGIDGMDISGASSQWNRGAWAQKGALADLPPGTVCILYRRDKGSNPMGHTGIALGDGTVVHAKGTAYGVVRDQISPGKWTDWAVPVGMLDAIEAPEGPESEGQYMTDVVAVYKVTGGRLALRERPEKAAARLCWLPEGETVDVLDDTPPLWWRVRYGGQTGYALCAPERYLSRAEGGETGG